MTSAYRSAQENADKSVTIPGSDDGQVQPVTITGEQIVEAMRGTEFAATTAERYVPDLGNALADASRDTSTVTFYGSSLLAPNGQITDYEQRVTAFHEATHILSSTKQWDNRNEGHQRTFDDVARQFIPKPWLR